MIRLNLVEITDKWATNYVLNTQQCLDTQLLIQAQRTESAAE